MKLTSMMSAAALTVLLSAQCVAHAAEEGAGVLTVHVIGFTDVQGHAVAKLFRPGDNVLEKGRWEVSATVKDGQAVMAFPPLPAGPYALVVFHDRNDNGRIDHGWTGPSELLGFSGRFKLSLWSGRPTFDELKFEFDGVSRTMDVTVK